jgi:hypothetical protein
MIELKTFATKNCVENHQLTRQDVNSSTIPTISFAVKSLIFNSPALKIINYKYIPVRYCSYLERWKFGTGDSPL